MKGRRLTTPISNAITGLECRIQPDYLLSTYIVLEELRFDWRPDEVEHFEKLWNGGVPIAQMVETLGRQADEIALLIMDRKRKNKIKNRPGGVFGGSVVTI